MFSKLVVTAIVLMIALLLVDVSADVLQAWAVKEHNEREQGWLIHSHRIDEPPVGTLG
jgi:hypothetical protein